MAYVPTTVRLLLVSCLLHGVLYLANAQTCPVQSWANKALFGGGTRKQDGTAWSKACNLSPRQSASDNAFSCTSSQRRIMKSMLGTLNEGLMYVKPCEVFPYIRGRTVWLVGDSHAKSLYLAFGCYFYEFWNRRECHVSTDKQVVKKLFSSWQGDPIQASCMHLPGKTRICLIKGVLGTALTYNSKIPGGGYLNYLQSTGMARQGDIFYVTFGAWHRKKPAFPFNPQGYSTALKNLAAYYKSTAAQWPHVFFLHTPAAHPNWAPGATNCLEYQGVSIERARDGAVARLSMANRAVSSTLEKNVYTSRQFFEAAESTLRGSGVEVVGQLSHKISVVGGEQHVNMVPNRGRGGATLDCIHFCHPGIPELWIWELYDALRKGATGLKPKGGNQLPPLTQTNKCAPTGTSVL